MPEHFLPLALHRLNEYDYPILISDFEKQVAETAARHGRNIDATEVTRLMFHYELAKRVNGKYMRVNSKAKEEVNAPKRRELLAEIDAESPVVQRDEEKHDFAVIANNRDCRPWYQKVYQETRNFFKGIYIC